MESYSHTNPNKNEIDQLNLIDLPDDVLIDIFRVVQRQDSNLFTQLYQLTLVSKRTKEIASDIICRDIIKFNLKQFITWYYLYNEDKSMAEVGYCARLYDAKNHHTIENLLKVLAQNLANQVSKIEDDQIYALVVALLAGTHRKNTRSILKNYIFLIHDLLGDCILVENAARMDLIRVFQEFKRLVKEELLIDVTITIDNISTQNNFSENLRSILVEIANKVIRELFLLSSFTRKDVSDLIAQAIGSHPKFHLYEEELAKLGFRASDFLLQELLTKNVEKIEKTTTSLGLSASLHKIYTYIQKEIMLHYFHYITPKEFKKYLDNLANRITFNNIIYLNKTISLLFRYISMNKDISRSMELLKIARDHSLFKSSKLHRLANKFKMFAPGKKTLPEGLAAQLKALSDNATLSIDNKLKQAINILKKEEIKLLNKSQNNNNNNNNNKNNNNNNNKTTNNNSKRFGA